MIWTGFEDDNYGVKSIIQPESQHLRQLAFGRYGRHFGVGGFIW